MCNKRKKDISSKAWYYLKHKKKKLKHKKKNAVLKSSFSSKDKFIYYLLIALTFIASLLLVYLWDDIRNAIAFLDPSVIAYHEHSSALLSIPLVGYLEMSGMVFFMVRLSDRKPVFGNLRTQHGKDPWNMSHHLLFDSGRKRETVKLRTKIYRRHMRFIWGMGLLIAMSFSLFSFFGRDCLCRDCSIISYNMLNRQTDRHYSENDYSHLTLYIELDSGRYFRYWKYGFSIETNDGRRFSFSNHDFDWRNDRYQNNCLETMLEIKALFTQESISIIGADSIDRVIDFIGLNSEQAQLLHNLFLT